MADVDGYEPWNPPRLCDTCGDLYRLSQMRRLPGGIWSCNEKCAGERSATELSRANARQKPFLYRPVKNAKPEDPFNPDTFEADDAAILGLVARMTQAGSRYESVASGDPAPLSGNMLDGLSWAAIYLYGMIADNTRSRSEIARAKSLLLSIATQLTARQQGFGISTSSTKTNDAFFGGFLGSGEAVWYTENAATAGLAILYAYRVFATPSYLVSARAAASYLRNVQAIGSNGTSFTSMDSTGSARLYTGSLASQLSSGFVSNNRFYPSALLALRFWNELKTTDGDQQIGSDGTPAGFTTTPHQLLSTSITDLRSCWSTGITDSTGTLVNGLSSSTPREFFNAYPTGTGRWEFQDGDASTGTKVTSLNFCKAISALFAYEGASTQVTTIDDWMRSFASNTAYETAANTSDYTLARATTGTYDPTVCPSTLLLVRDSTQSYAATAKNGSSLYDWGAFGLLAALWSGRNGTFAEARRSACGNNYRYFDRQRTDGDYIDQITLRGESGLSYQTAFAVSYGNGLGNDGGSTPYSTSTTSVEDPRTGLVFEVNRGIGSTGGRLTSWANQATGPNPGLLSAGDATSPRVGVDSLDGVPGVTWEDSDVFAYQYAYLASTLGVAITMKDRNGINFGYGTGETQARTCVAVIRPRWISGYDIVGGTVMRFGQTAAGGNQDFEALFNVEPTTPSATNFMLQSNQFRTGPTHLCGPSGTTGGAAGTYTGVPVLVIHRSTGFNNITVSVNRNNITLNPAVQQAAFGGAAVMQSFAFGSANQGGDLRNQFHGAIFFGRVYDHALSESELTNLYGIIGTQFPSLGIPGGATIAMVNDVMRASMFGLSLRQAPRSTTAPSN